MAEFTRLRLLLEPLESIDALDNYCRTFFDIELPYYQVDELSTSNHLKFVWQVYQSFLTGKGPSRHVLACSRNSGKCLKIGTLVATPTGPVEIQNLKVGDTVYDEFGKPIKVTAVHDQGMQDCVDLIHNRTVLATCTPEHIWLTTQDGVKKTSVRIKDFKHRTKIVRQELSLPLGTVDEPLAYALGALIGDGCSTEPGIRLSSSSDLIPNKIAKLLQTEAKKCNSNNFSWIILDPRTSKEKHYHWKFSEFYEQNIRNKLAHQKTTDLAVIKTWNRKSLLAFVAGLIDSDGSICRPKKFNKNQITFTFGMQSKSTVEAMVWAVMALWQIDLKMIVESREYKNGPMYVLKLCHNYHLKRILKELDEHIVTPSKKWKDEYSELLENNYRPRQVGIDAMPAGKHRCWDITVDSDTSLYCLQNGLVTHNTLVSSIIQYFSLLHFRRDGLQLSATLDQSASAITYIGNLMNQPELLPYLQVDNTRTKRFEGLPATDFTKKTSATLRVATATKKGTNSQRCNTALLDEVDLTPKEILSEVGFVADVSRDEYRYRPVFVYLSSRKTNDGPIQSLIDEAEGPKGKTGRISLHKWSQADMMEKCLPEVHLPDQPVMAYLNTDNLKVIWGKDEFNAEVGEAAASAYKEINAFEGCKTCPAFVACQARAPKQKAVSRMLRSREFVGDVLDLVGDSGVIIAQSLNWRAENTGLVFKNFSYNNNVKDAVNMYFWAIGKHYSPDGKSEEEVVDILYNSGNLAQIRHYTPTKIDIYTALVKNGWKIHYGIDWGQVDPAVCVITAYHRKTHRVMILHVARVAKEKSMANHLWAEYIATEIWPQMPGDLVAPDMADAASPSYFGKHNIPCLSKKPHRVETGVSQLRGLIWNPITQTSDLQVLITGENDPNHLCLNEFTHWTHAKTPMGWNFNKFDEDNNNHTLDAIRYALNPFVKDIKVTLNAKQLEPETVNDVNEYLAVSEGRRREIMERDGKSQLAAFFAQEHGVSGVFEQEKKKRALDAAAEANRKMRMNQREMLEEQRIASETTPEPRPGVKTRLKYSF